MSANASNQGWPYHLYDGNDPRKQGSYVKCASNPCSLHGGSDIYAGSPEEAYEKANSANGWGFVASSGNAGIMKTSSAETVHSHDDSSIAISSRDEYLKSEGLYVYDSPVFHVMDEHQSTYDLARQVFGDTVDYADNADIENRIYKNSEKVYDSLTDSEKHSLNMYSDTMFRTVNRTLRENLNIGGTMGINACIADMSSAMKKSGGVLERDTVFYRRRYMNATGASRGAEEKAAYRAVADDGNVDNVITRADFMSTSTSHYSFDGDEDFVDGMHLETNYIIKAPAGTRGLFLVNSEHSGEHEFLIDKGYKMKVTGIYEPSLMEKADEFMLYEDNDDKYVFTKQPVIVMEIVPMKD